MPCRPVSALCRWAALTAVLLLSACAESQTGVSGNARSKFQSVAVVPRINDRLLSAYWSSPLASPVVSEANMGWNMSSGAGQIATEILGRAGATVAVTSAPTTAAAKAAQAVVVLQQTPMNALAEHYDPGQDLLFSAISIAGAAQSGGLGYLIIDDERNYKPVSVLRITSADGGNSGNPNVCVVGLTPSLVDPATGETSRRGRSLVGVEKLPGPLSGRGWSTMSASERSMVLSYCQSALRRVVSQSFVELGVVD